MRVRSRSGMLGRRLRWSVFASCLVAFGLVPSGAAASEQPMLEAGAPALAQQRYLIGRRQYRAGDFEAAAREFQSALEIFPGSVKLAYNLARTLERLDRIEDALEAYKRYLRLAKGADDREQVERVVAGLVERLRARRARAVVSSVPAGASVYLDDASAPAGTTPMTLEAPPGAHLLRLELAGHRTALRTLELRAGASEAVAVELEAAPDAPQPKAEAVAEPSDEDWRQPIGWTAIGLGAAATGAGVYFMLSALDTADEATGLPGEEQARYDRLGGEVEDLQIWMWSALGAGLALAGAGTALLMSAEDTPTVSVSWVGAGATMEVVW